MGSSTSKAVSKAASASKAAAKNTTRKYPTRVPPASSTTDTTAPSTSAGQQVHLDTRASRNPETNRDASDPGLALAARLQQLGPVNPTPTQSNSSTFNSASPSIPQFRPSASAPSQSVFPAANPAVSLLTARYRLAEEAEKEFESVGRRGAQGRMFLDVVTLRQVVILRDKGMTAEQIERTLELRSGVVGRLGGKGIVSATGMD